MNTSKFLPSFAVLCALFSACAVAADFSEPARFEKKEPVETGHVRLSSPAGQYRYGKEADDRKQTAPIAIGRATRDDYQFFSWQEEEALWYVLQDQIEQENPPKAKRIKTAFKARIDWPRVVIKGQNTVCVPELPQAKADQWMDHLVCTDVKEILE